MTKTVLQHIRHRLEEAIPMRPSLRALRRTEWSKQFEILMRNRLIMGSFRYGLLKSKGERGYDMIRSIRQRLDQYEKTGNLEAMVDIANLALLEFEHPGHPASHMEAEDDGIHCA